MKQNITGVGKRLKLGTTVTITGANTSTLTIESTTGSTGNILVNNVETSTILSGSMKDNAANVIIQNNALIGTAVKFATGTADVVSQDNNLTDLNTFDATITTPALLPEANFIYFSLGYQGTVLSTITKLINLTDEVENKINNIMTKFSIPYEVYYDAENNVLSFSKTSEDENVFIYVFKIYDNTYGAQITGNNDGSINATANLANGSVAVTQTQGDNSTKVATTEYVDTAAANAAINLENYTV